MIHPLNEDRILIDADSRKISVPKQFAAAGVCGDTNAETVYIYCPRYFDNIDWYNRKCLVRFVNAGGEYGEFVVTDMKIDPSDNDMLIIGWMIQSPVTSYTGTIQFTLQFETVTDDELIYQWQTQPAQMKILNGIDSSVGAGSSSSLDTYTALSQRLTALEELVQTIDLADSMNIINENIRKVNLMEQRVEYLEDNVIYLSVPNNGAPEDISYSVVVKDPDGNPKESFILYYGNTHTINLLDSTGATITDLIFSSDSSYVTVNSDGLVSVNYSFGMPSEVTATITSTHFSSMGYAPYIRDIDNTSIDSFGLSIANKYKIKVEDKDGEDITSDVSNYTSDTEGIIVSEDGIISASYVTGMNMVVEGTITMEVDV